jgi:predicted amidophosphoribosyltransferase
MGLRLGRSVQAAGLDLDLTAIVPVPSHPLAQLRRGFNPATELARPVSTRLGVPIRSGYLRRRLTRPGRTARRGPAGRFAEARDAFLAAGRIPENSRLLLVDDVLTTGATARACLEALRNSGAAIVSLAVWARTPKRDPRALPIGRPRRADL